MKITNEYSYIVGLWFGDGGKTINRYELSLGENKEYNNIQKLLSEYFGTEVKKKKIDNWYRLRVLKSQSFIKKLKEKIQTGELLNELRTNPFPFITGFINTDGWIEYSNDKNDKNGLLIQIANTNYEFLQMVQILLIENNLYSVIKKVKILSNKNNMKKVVKYLIPIKRLKQGYVLQIKTKPTMYIVGKKIRNFILKKYAKDRINTFIEKYEKLRLATKIPILEVFHSLQGEGTLIGSPQIFVRTAGCNLKCPSCDTKESWTRGDKYRITMKELIDKIQKFDCKSVCITGGEATLYVYNIQFLIAYLKSEGYYVNIQTNGTRFEKSIFNIVDKVCMDIKFINGKCMSNLSYIKKLRPNIDEIKVLVGNKKELMFAKKINKIASEHNILTIIQVKNNVGKDTLESLVKKYKWVIVQVINDKKYTWNNIRLLPQLHVWIWGNRKGI